MKKLLALSLVFFTVINSFSQSFTPPSYAEVDYNYRNYGNNVFGALEANRVPTGLLLDYAFDFTEPKN